MGEVIDFLTIDTNGTVVRYDIKKSVEKSIDDETIRALKFLLLSMNWFPCEKKWL